MAELIQLAEIARRTGTPAGTLYSRRCRGQFPPPDVTLGRVPFWRWPDIAGRLHTAPAVEAGPVLSPLAERVRSMRQ